MSTWVAFLRAINLGRTRKFAKDDIAAATEAAGFTGVATHINTGNVRLETRMRSRARIEESLERAYRDRAGFEVPTICLTDAELRRVVEDAASLADRLPEGGTHYVSLLKAEPDAATVAAVQELADAAGEGAGAAVVLPPSRAVHLLVGDPYHAARLTNAEVERTLGVATNRNLRVLAALVEKWC
ncbi:DUF1697 domain-containing protein [Nocardioides nanhaiensis]|uniref:DUF1697 domain-containing protein n=1 Tax=Nocardioides nanhaiensis TaxID=1476871 RepID=A0ABP8W3N4_9ACTN